MDDDQPVSQRPTAEDIRRWQRALDAVAERVRTERGVVEPVRIQAGGNMLYAHFGELLTPIGGDDGVTDELQLFGQIDWWVAFDRRGDPPPRVLDRDHEFIAQLRAQLPAAQTLWQKAAEQVLADVGRTTSLRWDWRVTVRDSSPDWPEPSAAGFGLSISFAPATGRPPQRRLQLPELRLEGNDWGIGLPEDPANLAEATAHLADEAKDRIIENTHQPWPRCPRHDHPLSVEAANVAVWTCPTSHEVVAEVGQLQAAA